MGEPDLGKWLGVSHRVGPEMSYSIFPELYRPISCTTMQILTILEQQEKNWVNRIEVFEVKIKKILDTSSAEL